MKQTLKEASDEVKKMEVRKNCNDISKLLIIIYAVTLWKRFIAPYFCHKYVFDLEVLLSSKRRKATD